MPYRHVTTQAKEEQRYLAIREGKKAMFQRFEKARKEAEERGELKVIPLK
jgi:hypothetical protein